MSREIIVLSMKMVKMFCFLSFFSLGAWASNVATQACLWGPKNALQVVDKAVRNMAEKSKKMNSDDLPLEGTTFPNHLVFHSKVDFEDTETETVSENSLSSSKENPPLRIHYEALLRPKKTDQYNLLNLIMFKLERPQHLLYVCLNYNAQNRSESQLVIYFLSAYGLSQNPSEKDFLNRIGDWTRGPEGIFRGKESSVAGMARLPIQLVPLHFLTNNITDWMRGIPLLGRILSVPGFALKLSGKLIDEMTEKLGVGVERIIVNEKEMIFSNRVNPDNPEDSSEIYRWNLAKHGVQFF